MERSSTVDTLRRVQLKDANELDVSGVMSIRARRWRWTIDPPIKPGWYAMRWSGNRRSRTMYLVTDDDITELAQNPDWLRGVEFSDKPVQWPLEQEENETDPVRLWERRGVITEEEYADTKKLSPGSFVLGLLAGIVLPFILIVTIMYH